MLEMFLLMKQRCGLIILILLLNLPTLWEKPDMKNILGVQVFILSNQAPSLDRILLFA